jgi:hypothetical protein
VAIWNILQPFGMFYCHLVYMFCGNLVSPPPIWYFAPRKIWQSCPDPLIASIFSARKFPKSLFMLLNTLAHVSTTAENETDASLWISDDIFYVFSLKFQCNKNGIFQP